jgi:hypothetical protein
MTNRRRYTWMIAACCSTILSAAVGCTLHGKPAEHILEIDLRTSAGSAAQLYWHAGEGFSEAQSVRLPLERSGNLQQLRFPLPALNLLGVRFDPTDAPADISVSGIRVLDSRGNVVWGLNPASLLPAHEVASMRPEATGVRIVTNGNDPFVFLPAACVVAGGSPFDRIGLSKVTPLSLSLVSALVIALLVAALLAVAHDLFRRNDTTPVGGSQSRALAAGWLAAMFLTCFSAKLLLMHYYPARVPYEDQWWSESQGLYIPFHDGCLSWREMFSLHNEHRVFFTRLLALGLLFVNGQWDPQVQQVVNASIHAATAALLAGMFWIVGGRRQVHLIALAAGAVFTLPFGWENTLAGFQSAFYFLLLFTVLALWLTIRHPAGSWQWLLGWFFALCSLFTSAGGLMTPIALLVLPALGLITRRQSWRELGLTIAAAAGVLAVGIATVSPPIPHHEPYRAATVGALATALARNSAWPWIDSPILSVLMWLPLLAMVPLAFRHIWPATELEQLTCALAAWTALQALALAYSRGVGGAAPASRYMDILSMGFVANAMAFLAVHDRFAGQPFKARLAMGALLSWLVFALVGMGGITKDALRTGALTRRAWMDAYTRNVREFLVTDDASAFAAKPFPFQVPYSNPLLLANAWLRHPYLKGILPPDIREPLRIASDSSGDAPFVRDGVNPTTPIDPDWISLGSFTRLGNPSVGRFESHTLQPCGRTKFLKFQVAGYLGEPELSLSVREVASGRQHNVRLARLAKERWMDASVSCPHAPYTVVAEDRRSDIWFAFREPVEVGWMTILADGLVARALGLLLISLATACVALRLT